MHDAIEQEPLRIFDDVLRNHRDYFEALTTRHTFVNGPLAAYLRTSGGGVVYDIDEPIVDMPYDADWTAVTRGSTHSGVLTTMAYLERFTSERGRAHRFIQAFLCSDFSSISLPPAQPQPPIDLAQREGCNGCHASLEPLTQYWGHFRINLDFGTLDDGSGTFATLGTSTMNPRAPTCATCARTSGTCPEYCNLYYWTYDNSPSWDRTHVGQLQVAAFDWSSPGLDDDRARFDGGPAALVATNLARTDPHAPSPMESCAVEQRAESLLHRHLTADERSHWLPALADAFQASGVHDFRDLERAIVNDPRYRGLGMSR